MMAIPISSSWILECAPVLSQHSSNLASIDLISCLLQFANENISVVHWSSMMFWKNLIYKSFKSGFLSKGVLRNILYTYIIFRGENSLSTTVLLRVTIYVSFVPWSSLPAAPGSLSAAAFPEVHREYLRAALKVWITST